MGLVHMGAKELRVYARDHHTDRRRKPGGEDMKRLKKSKENILPENSRELRVCAFSSPE